MEVRVAKALMGCAAKRLERGLGSHMVRSIVWDGSVAWATDGVLAAAYRDEELRDVSGGVFALSAEDLAKVPPKARLTVDAEGWRDEEGRRYGRELTLAHVTAFGDLWEPLTKEQAEIDHGFDPKLMKRALSVFEAAGVGAVRMEDGGTLMAAEGFSGSAHVRAVVMGKRL